MNIPLALNYLRPSEKWSLNGDTYEGLTWLSDSPQPTEQELIDAYPQAQAAKAAQEQAEAQARQAAIDHAKSLGFTDQMIAVMYPNLGVQA